MAVVKTPLEASKVTLESKWQRYERIKRLFGIRRLGDLFPPHSTPNAAANDPLICSGDVLRDLCQIGEALKNKGVGRAERVEMVKKEFKEGVIVQHREIRDLLAKFRKNEFEERLKSMREKEGGGEGDATESTFTTSTNKTTFTAPVKDARAATLEMDIKEEPETKFATADQIRADLRRRSDLSLLKRKRPSTPDFVDFKADENNITTLSPFKRSKPFRDPLTPHTTRQIAQNTNTAPAKLTGRKMVSEDDTTMAKRYHDVVALVKNLDIIIGNAAMKMRDDVEGAEQFLTTARNLIASSLASQNEH
jgi:hypothetical protein